MSLTSSYRSSCVLMFSVGLALAVTFLCSSCGDAPPAPASSSTAETVARPSLLLISVDTLRADHMGIYGYRRATTPRIDAWFENGQIFDAAYTTEANTSPSVVSFLTGMLPQDHGVRLLYQKMSSDVTTVADLLGEAGYQTAAVISNIVLTAEAIGRSRIH